MSFPAAYVRESAVGAISEVPRDDSVGAVWLPMARRLQGELQRDGFTRGWLVLTVGVVLAVAWVAWSLLAPLAVRVEAAARIERPIHPIEAPVAGRVLTVHARLRDRVQAGETLIQLEDRTQVLALDEVSRQRDSIATDLATLEEVIRAEEHALQVSSRGKTPALEEARLLGDRAEAAALLAEAEAQRMERLDDHVADAERQDTRNRALQQRSVASASRRAVERIHWERVSEETDRRAQLAERRREATRLGGELATLASRIERLQEAVELRKIRAPVTGELGEWADLVPGAVVSNDQWLGVIVGAGDMQIVAHFSPADAVGRIRPGDRARLRLDGFPWTQFGSLAATVTRVASEARDGRVRVELQLAQRSAASAIPLQHGLPGTVEVEVEELTPFALLVRAAGRLVNS